MTVLDAAGIDNATGEHHAAVFARDEGLKAALDSSQTSEHLHAHFHVFTS